MPRLLASRLDWPASELVGEGFRLKALHRLLVNSVLRIIRFTS